jgi:hypothetical protein
MAPRPRIIPKRVIARMSVVLQTSRSECLHFLKKYEQALKALEELRQDKIDEARHPAPSVQNELSPRLQTSRSECLHFLKKSPGAAKVRFGHWALGGGPRH